MVDDTDVVCSWPWAAEIAEFVSHILLTTFFVEFDLERREKTASDTEQPVSDGHRHLSHAISVKKLTDDSQQTIQNSRTFTTPKR